MTDPRTQAARTVKSLVLIRARNLAESVTTPTFIADSEGTLVFYNEAAEALVGRPFSDVGNRSAAEWQEAFNVRSRDGTPFPLEAMPGWMELQRERPTLGHMRFTSFDGTDHFVAVCALPLFATQDRFEGAVMILWDEED